MKKIYKEPEINIVFFDLEDIATASGDYDEIG
jgi:hypothetical protein